MAMPAKAGGKGVGQDAGNGKGNTLAGKGSTLSGYPGATKGKDKGI
jgi:hypothetical protein